MVVPTLFDFSAACEGVHIFRSPMERTKKEKHCRRGGLAAGFQFGEDLLGDFFQGFEDAYALECDGFHDRLVLFA